MTFLIMDKNPATKEMAKQIGPYYSGIAAYVGSAAAMIIFSLLKPKGGQTA
jgi:hypothetical protein